MFLRSLFSSKEDRERRNNKPVIKKLYKKLDRWDDMYSDTIVEYIRFLVRVYKNLNLAHLIMTLILINIKKSIGNCEVFIRVMTK